MAGSKSNFLENALLNHVLGNQAYSAPATVHVALFTSSPNDAGGGTEVTGNNYARAAVTNNTTNWPATSSGSKSNGTTITFNQATPSGWGSIVAFAIFDAASAGNMIIWGDFTSAKTVNALDTPTLNATDITWTED